ncbi:MAG: hypothetical protein SWX82_15895 [Cyanobacteriota bacterium]|nr:hypothetical protein [Cyanobacteriota bacterium]
MLNPTVIFLPYSPTPPLPYSLMHKIRCVGLVGYIYIRRQSILKLI